MTLAASPGFGEPRRFAARLAALHDAAAYVRACCELCGIEREDGLRVALVVEELFTNTVRHGYGGDSDAPIEITLLPIDNGIEIRYEDAAPPFDPVPAFRDPLRAPSGPAEARPVGGLGIVLIGALLDDARYRREDERNRLWLTIACARREATQ